MNINKIVFVAASGVVAYAAHSFFEFRQQQIQQRSEIALHTDEEIQRIWMVAGRIREKIARGDYDGKSMDDIKNDFEFYRLAERIQD